ncbi:hypothetical protein FLJC2902T_13160 [Flavobacterium limnosediminis JC2902]|uniref:Metallo-beta-lactamase domain-containing protein n=1 Tax=Flavobacterium limnosediminis JC2902 TaxID=1341181 RepID=V6SQK3_9FLAO|nr:MBL fold metallo-hydrolase [Flavobacterium limnosediminis]ESU28724.1 hypothetical protein FLJC2902T_13160 [Flavobacterium limnosediminis JC2902]
MNINILKANNGDSIHISYADDIGKMKNILIDGGTSTTYTFKNKITGKINDGDLKKTIEGIRPNKIDLLILTHIDDDHIDGFLKWFSKDKDAIESINEVWFNSGNSIKKILKNKEAVVDSIKFKEKTTLTSVKQGNDFEQYIKEKGVWDEKIIKKGDELIWDSLSFKILSPGNEKLGKLLKEWKSKSPESLFDTSRKNDYKRTFRELMEEDKFEEDNDPYNGSSIAFILKKEDLNYLFLGDSHPSELIDELGKLGYNGGNKLAVELIKLSHHGSKKNNPVELFKLIDTSKYIISTNGDQHGHPDKATIARILSVNQKAEIYFNYPTLISKIILEEDKKDFPDVKYLGVESL